MTKEFRYRPPIFYIFIGLGGLFVSYVLFNAIGYGEVGFQFLVAFFGLTCFILGTTFTLRFVARLDSQGVKIADDFVEIPGRWRKRVTIKFSDTTRINRINTFDNVIEISTENNLHLIEGNCMNRNDFQELKGILIKRINAA